MSFVRFHCDCWWEGIAMARTTLSASSDNSAIAAASVFLIRLFPSPRDFAMRLWDGTVIEADGGWPRFTLAFKTPGALRRMFGLPVEMSLAEAYIRNDFDIEGEMFAAFRLFDAFGSHPWSPKDLLA